MPYSISSLMYSFKVVITMKVKAAVNMVVDFRPINFGKFLLKYLKIIATQFW